MVSNFGWTSKEEAIQDVLKHGKKLVDVIIYKRSDCLWGWMKPTPQEIIDFDISDLLRS